jgi:hypothetical protein
MNLPYFLTVQNVKGLQLHYPSSAYKRIEGKRGSGNELRSMNTLSTFSCILYENMQALVVIAKTKKYLGYTYSFCDPTRKNYQLTKDLTVLYHDPNYVGMKRMHQTQS